MDPSKYKCTPTSTFNLADVSSRTLSAEEVKEVDTRLKTKVKALEKEDVAAQYLQLSGSTKKQLASLSGSQLEVGGEAVRRRL